MAKLIQLPDGTWVEPAEVKRVEAMPRARGASGLLHAPRVIVGHGAFGCTQIDCESEDEATEMRDRIAGEVNAAREGVDARDLAPGEGP